MFIWLPAVMGGWDPVVIEQTWSIYDCLDAMKALQVRASVMSHMFGKLGSGIKGRLGR